MKRATPIALLLALLVTLPGFATARETAHFPDDLNPLVGAWISEAEQFAGPLEGRDWYANASRFLQEAREAHASQRLRVAMYDVETFYELARTGIIMDETRALTSDADKRSLTLERTQGWRDEAESEWLAFRADLHAMDGRLQSLHSIERALFAADNAILARVQLDDHDALAREFPKQSTFEEGYVLALVRAGHTTLLNLQWSRDLLATVDALEGIEPRADTAAWANVTADSLVVPPADEQTPPHLVPFETLAGPVRENQEGILAVAIELAELRAARASSIFVIFGDARTRGKDVVNDAARNMGRQLDNTTQDVPTSYGLQGVFTADAIDRAAYTLSFAEKGQAELGLIVGAWASLDHAGYVINALSFVSPIRPPPVVEEKETPSPGVAFAFAAVAIATVLRTSRRR